MSSKPDFNGGLARRCGNACAACCKRGKLFLPGDEHLRIRDWVIAYAPGELAGFDSRCEEGDGFVLYDQQESCGFLSADNLCGLHDTGVKPTECFAWPFHVYATDSDSLEIRYSDSCCLAHMEIEADPSSAESYATDILSRYDRSTILSFRKAYGGSYGTKPLCEWKDAT